MGITGMVCGADVEFDICSDARYQLTGITVNERKRPKCSAIWVRLTHRPQPSRLFRKMETVPKTVCSNTVDAWCHNSFWGSQWTPVSNKVMDEYECESVSMCVRGGIQLGRLEHITPASSAWASMQGPSVHETLLQLFWTVCCMHTHIKCSKGFIGAQAQQQMSATRVVQTEKVLNNKKRCRHFSTREMVIILNPRGREAARWRVTTLTSQLSE